MRLGPKDYDLALATVGEIYSWRTMEEFKHAQHVALLTAIPADHSSWAEWQFAAPSPRMLHWEESEPLIDAQYVATAERAIPRHPFTQYFTRTRDPSALILSDFLSQAQIEHDPDFWLHRQYGGTYAMSVGCGASRGDVAAFSFVSESRDFTERDRLMLNLLQPHYIRSRRNAGEWSRLLASGAAGRCEGNEALLAELTRRESEVARWVAQGKTNGEIGMILSASSRTIEKHVQRVLKKLRVENRVAAAILLNEVRAVRRLR